jgi:hypothetical protein
MHGNRKMEKNLAKATTKTIRNMKMKLNLSVFIHIKVRPILE